MNWQFDIVCENCGGHNIEARAPVYWSPEKHKWIINEGDVLSNFCCIDCFHDSITFKMKDGENETT